MGIQTFVSDPSTLKPILTITANTMANGKDFFVELRKQMYPLLQQQQANNASGG
jgi:hypothetical protein